MWVDAHILLARERGIHSLGHVLMENSCLTQATPASQLKQNMVNHLIKKQKVGSSRRVTLTSQKGDPGGQSASYKVFLSCPVRSTWSRWNNAKNAAQGLLAPASGVNFFAHINARLS